MFQPYRLDVGLLTKDDIVDLIKIKWLPMSAISEELWTDRKILLALAQVNELNLHRLNLEQLGLDFLAQAIELNPSIYSQLPEHYQYHQLLLEALLKHHPYSLKRLPEGLLANRYLVTLAFQHQPNRIEELDLALRADRQIATLALQQDGYQWTKLAPELQADPHLALLAVQQDGLVLKHLPSELQANREIVLAAVRQEGLALRHADPQLQGDYRVVLAAIKSNSLALESASQQLRANFNLVSLAVKTNPFTIRYAQPTVFAKKKQALWFLRRGLAVFPLIPRQFSYDRDIVLMFLRKVALGHGRAISFSYSLTDDPEVMLTALKVGYSLMEASQRLQADQSFVSRAVGLDGCNLRFADPSLLTNLKLLRKAVKSNWRAVEVFPKRILANRAIMLPLLTECGLLYEFLPHHLQQEPDIAKLALTTCTLKVWPLLPPSLQQDPAILALAVKLRPKLLTKLELSPRLKAELMVRKLLPMDCSCLEEVLRVSNRQIVRHFSTNRCTGLYKASLVDLEVSFTY